MSEDVRCEKMSDLRGCEKIYFNIYIFSFLALGPPVVVLFFVAKLKAEMFGVSQNQIISSTITTIITTITTSDFRTTPTIRIIGTT